MQNLSQFCFLLCYIQLLHALKIKFQVYDKKWIIIDIFVIDVLGLILKIYIFIYFYLFLREKSCENMQYFHFFYWEKTEVWKVLAKSELIQSLIFYFFVCYNFWHSYTYIALIIFLQGCFTVITRKTWWRFAEAI